MLHAPRKTEEENSDNRICVKLVVAVLVQDEELKTLDAFPNLSVVPIPNRNACQKVKPVNGKPPNSAHQQAKTAQTAVATEEWGKPVAIFNTRIPVELSSLLDDLVYRRKKEGTPVTRQQLAIEALSNLVAAAGLL